MKNDDRKSTTTDAAIPVASDEHSLTVGPDGPILLQDHYLIEQMANFNRERIAERQPHAKGSGAFGYFEVTKDVRIGTAVFEISEPRIPCWRLGVRMNDQGFVRRFTEALRPGTYLRIILEGAVGAADEIRVIERPDHDLTVRDIFRIYTRDRGEVERLLAVPRLSESWRGWAQRFLKETKGRRAGSAPGCC
jgi:Catalase/MOSC domain/3-alpha domain